MKHTLALLALTVAVTGFAQDKVIYGDDNRHEVFDYPDRVVQDLARSTVALIKARDLSPMGGVFKVPTETFAEGGVCSSERFANQPTAAFCSGFLVAPNKIVTAGHCITSDSGCAETRFLFDYKMNDASNAQVTFSSSQIYSCKKVLGQVQIGNNRDFAVIELDRPVADRTPLKMSDNKNLTAGSEIFVIGHPAGLPAKITDSANVRTVKTDSGFFVANLDTYGGNSGSAVFNAKTLEVEGILVRGERDYINNGDCRVSYRVDNNAGRGEDVTLISKIHENGYERVTETPTTPTTPTTGSNVRYIWLNSDQTCNEFHGNNYIREVPAAMCNMNQPVRYVWLNSDQTCNEFRGNSYVREVANSLCGH